MKVSEEHFQVFIAEFKRLVNKLELNNWRVDFVLQKDLGSFGRCIADIGGYVATIMLCDEWDDSIRPLTTKTLKETAKHEINHLMIARLECQAKSRFVSAAEVGEAAEELVRKLSFAMKKL
jgi:hypothetical protein